MTPISPDQYETFCFTCGACTGTPWVGLTDEEISELYYLSGYGSKEYDGGANSFARAIEAKLKEKNT